MAEQQGENGTTNVLLIFIVIILVGGAVYFFTKNEVNTDNDSNTPSVNLNLGGEDESR